MVLPSEATVHRLIFTTFPSFFSDYSIVLSSTFFNDTLSNSVLPLYVASEPSNFAEKDRPM